MTAATDSMSPVVEKKKKNVSKRLKKSWRKHIDFKDVDEFLDKQCQEERIGGPASLKKDEDLFVIDVLPEKESRVEKNLPLTKKQRALLPMTCYKGLESLTAVPDPIVKRNRVRTKAERESIIVKQNRMKKHMSGVESKKVVRARLDRQRALKQKKAQPKGVVFQSDLWDQKETKLDLDWLNKDTLEHNLSKTGRFKIRAPRGILTKKSVLPSLEIPHPGTSYNPSVTDHQALLREVADKELEKQKNEAHLERVTSACFTKVTPEEKQARWVEEMSQGLVKVEEDDEVEIKEEQLSDDENTNENLRLSIGPPSNRLKAKTRKQRRTQRRLRDEAQKRKEAKVEKKKISDVYRIRLVKGSVDKMDQKQQLMAERRKKLAEAHKGRTKRLGRQQYVEPDVDFSRPCELRSRLNLVKKQGNLLADRYLSLQKRNMLAPGTKQIKKRKAKVKRFVKASHKMEEDLPQKKKKTRQVK